MSIGGGMDTRERPSFVQFEIRPVQDRAETEKQGYPAFKDEEFAIVTAPGGGNTVVEMRVSQFLRNKEKDPFFDLYKKQHQAWQEGKEAPTEGMPLTEWPGITPAQVKACQNTNIRSVEDLATAPETALTRIGTGARALQAKAMAYLVMAARKA